MAENGKVVLVVEDSPVQALALVELLQQEGLEVLCAPNGRSGVTLAEQYLPDIIVLDVRMPEMDGLEACRQLKGNPHTANIPIVLLTAHCEPDVLKEGFEGGAIDFIPKDDFSGIVLLETLRQLNIL
jgi:CheY-like chemotaxis protein